MGIPKIEGEVGSCRYMYWFEGALKGKLGGGPGNFFRDN